MNLGPRTPVELGTVVGIIAMLSALAASYYSIKGGVDSLTATQAEYQKKIDHFEKALERVTEQVQEARLEIAASRMTGDSLERIVSTAVLQAMSDIERRLSTLEVKVEAHKQ